MTRLTGEFQTDLPVHEAVVACAEAIAGLGWHIEAVEANRIVSRTDIGSRHPLGVEVVLSRSGPATDVRIIGTDTNAEPLSRDALIAQLDRVRAAINASLEGAAAPSPQGPPAAAGRNMRLLIAAIIGLLAIALGMTVIAIVHDSSENLKRDRRGKSTSASQAKGSKPKTPQSKTSESKSSEGSAATLPQASQGTAASGSPGLGQTKEIRDGDQHFALTPTGVNREGSYITLDIEVAGIGANGYDRSGKEFLGTLFGSDGQRYEVASSGGPGGCEPPTDTLTSEQTSNGCLPFNVPPGIEADRFRYEPFFIGGNSVEWDLR
jgi:hypothetical protein